MKRKINIKEIIIFIIFLLFISSQILPRPVDNLDEIWNFNFARCISIGLTPYKDFNLILGPLLPFMCSVFLKIFGQEMIVMRFLALILDSIILFTVYKIMNELKIKDYFKYIILIILATIMKSYFTIDYNWMTLFLVLIIMYLEIKSEDNWKSNLCIGILAGVTVAVKQTTGLVILIATIGWKIIDIRNINGLKKYIKNAFIRMLGETIVILTFAIILLKLNAIHEYIDYCILGVTTFSNKISYIDGLIKSSNIVIRVLSIVPLFIYLTLAVVYKKTKKKEVLILLAYSIASMVMVYPISDEAHFVVAIPGTLIGISYLLDLWADKIKVPKKEEILANSFLESIVVLFSIWHFISAMIVLYSINKNIELNHFKYLPMDESGISSVKEIDEFIQNNSKDVYILDATASLYMIPIDRYNKNYDMFNIGNLGSKGEDGQIEKLKNTPNKIVLIRNKNYRRNWQNPEKVRKYIIDEMTKTGEIGIFDIYE